VFWVWREKDNFRTMGVVLGILSTFHTGLTAAMAMSVVAGADAVVPWCRWWPTVYWRLCFGCCFSIGKNGVPAKRSSPTCAHDPVFKKRQESNVLIGHIEQIWRYSH